MSKPYPVTRVQLDLSLSHVSDHQTLKSPKPKKRKLSSFFAFFSSYRTLPHQIGESQSSFPFFWLLQSNLSDRFNGAVRDKTLKEKKTIRTSSEPEFCLICRRGRVGIFGSLYKNPSWTSTSLEKLVCFFFSFNFLIQLNTFACNSFC